MVGGLCLRRLGDQISSNYIHSPEDAERVLKFIQTRLKEYRLDTLLLEIHQRILKNDFSEFPIHAFINMTKYTVLNCTMYGELTTIPDEEFNELMSMITEFESSAPERKF